jgi:CheY-like chemotaxis protein
MALLSLQCPQTPDLSVDILNKMLTFFRINNFINGNHMKPEKVIAGKYVLIVDDEQDVLDSLVELLDMCRLDTASSFSEAKKLLEENQYDIAVLDIMGVDGYELLKISNSRNIPALMLTAHALSSDNLKRSAEEGAAYYAPKDKINDIASFLADVFESIDEGKSPWIKVFDRLGRFFDQRFHGTDWREQQKEYFDKIISKGY